MGLVFGNIFNKSDNLYDYLDGNSLTAVAKRIETTTNQMLTENDDWFDKLCDFAYRMGLKYKDIPGYHPEVYQFEDFITYHLKAMRDRDPTKAYAGLYMMKRFGLEHTIKEQNYKEVIGMLKIGALSVEEIMLLAEQLMAVSNKGVLDEKAYAYDELISILYQKYSECSELDQQTLKDIQYRIVENRCIQFGQDEGYSVLNEMELLKGTEEQEEEFYNAIGAGSDSLGCILEASDCNNNKRVLRGRYLGACEYVREVLESGEEDEDLYKVINELLRMSKELRIIERDEILDERRFTFLLQRKISNTSELVEFLDKAVITNEDTLEYMKMQLQSYVDDFLGTDRGKMIKNELDYIQEFIAHGKLSKLYITDSGIIFQKEPLDEEEEISNMLAFIKIGIPLI